MTEPLEPPPSGTATLEAELSRKLGAFSVSEALRRAEPEPEVAGLGLQDANELRLLLRGESVVDWHRLDFETEADSRRLLALNGFDWADAGDRARIETLRGNAVDYLHNVLKFHVDEHVAQGAPFIELPLMASGTLGTHKQQRGACVLLKVMHILHHLDARELRTQLALADSELFESVEHSALEIFDQLRASGAPVVEFQWSRKTRGSLLTKMLIKRETSAARVFDRLRFRLIVKHQEDLVPTLHTMLRKLIPFNYVVPGQTVNTLVDLHELESLGPSPLTTDEGRLPDANEFSGANFRVINFIADLPVRVDGLVERSLLDNARGNVVFVLAEFQLIDRSTARANEEGESSHVAYKTRQHARVRERLLRVPSEPKAKASKKRRAREAEPEPEPEARVNPHADLRGRVVQADES
ncbi:hypothetical protein ENSA5_38390 [Enhygromyxa salina]|uniref:TIGR04552 family protein n=1 Tax=Enhygromyxa salina TaxID=215803 RepID=A0A2S9XRJ4_9BACT|nr:TIGR04552 family protein [Enhygromyxa salina]PRP95488.1 hypothetical protein ENSA5_38390 [Enhygromyxa salina]